jgi:hypothetical protein
MSGLTLKDTTALYHIWPWPLKLAIVFNLPAVIGGEVLGTPFRASSTTVGVILAAGITLFFVIALWLAVGHRLEIDRSQGSLPVCQYSSAHH